jgi:hypothetical protein
MSRLSRHVGSLTPHNLIGLQGLLRDSFTLLYRDDDSYCDLNRLFRSVVCCSPYSTVKMEAICFFKSSGQFQRTARRYVPEDAEESDLQNHCKNPTWTIIRSDTKIVQQGSNRWHGMYHFQCGCFKLMCLLLPSTINGWTKFSYCATTARFHVIAFEALEMHT